MQIAACSSIWSKSHLEKSTGMSNARANTSRLPSGFAPRGDVAGDERRRLKGYEVYEQWHGIGRRRHDHAGDEDFKSR